ncbi:MAG: heparan-alpha-glucosaminide N-acetyltransferase [Hydrogeniiclostridium sp.]
MKRIHLMDELRGFAVFCMVFYHGFYTLAFLMGQSWGEWLYRFFMPAEPWFAGLFIFIAGISSNLTHSNLVRGVKLLGVALLVTLATAIAVPEELIVFGILHFLSVCMIAFGLLQLLRRRLGRTEEPPFRLWPVVVCAVLFIVTRYLASGYLQIPFLLRVFLPSGWYQAWLAPLGLPGPGFSSADYFPLLPWCFVFAAGTVVGRLAKAGKFPAWTYPSRVPFFSFLGRHALLIYVLHQPVIYGAALLVQALASHG